MIIGIDIDDTLTNIGRDINIAAYNYAKKLGKDINDSGNNINIHIEEGELVGYIGENGVGKSTTIKMYKRDFILKL